MKRLFILFFFLIFVPAQSHALDYMVEFLAEKYREEPAGTDSPEKIYHTLQVDTTVGSRLLILGGKNPQYRIWLREYLVNHDKLILKVPAEGDASFRLSRAYETDVSTLHPVDEKKWKVDEEGMGPMPPYKGQKHILIVDANNKRRDLLELVVKDLGYPVTLSSSGIDALKMFRIQPDKFCMVITDNMIPGMNGAALVKNLMKTDPEIPVIFGTGYGKKRDKDFSSAFAGSDKIVVKPVVLRELSKTIINLLQKKA